ncbi:MAG TPA: hypothetical protein VN678_08355 [Acidobacteriaceae bacterium]|nr:hypothetical protein [Acidobacteriaceae bacterium]
MRKRRAHSDGAEAQYMRVKSALSKAHSATMVEWFQSADTGSVPNM